MRSIGKLGTEPTAFDANSTNGNIEFKYSKNKL